MKHMNQYKTIYAASDEEWKELRRKGIGGSDAASIIGLNKYKSAYQVWLEKTGRIESPDLSTNEAVKWGNKLEDMVAQEFKAQHPELKITNRNDTFISTDNEFMLANIDRAITTEDGKRGILEIKTAGQFRAEDWECGVPPYYLPQVIHYLAVTGWEFAYFAVLIGGQSYKEFFIERDESDIEALINLERQFWDMVKSDTAPQVTGYSSDSDILFKQFPKSDDLVEPVDDFPRFNAHIEEIQNIKTEIKELTTKKDELENSIKKLIGNNKGLYSDVYQVTWLRSESESFDKKSFQEEHPDLYTNYTNKKTRNMGLRIKEIN